MLLGKLRGRRCRHGARATPWRSPPAAAPPASGAKASSACWRPGRWPTWSAGLSTGIAFAGALSDPVEAWLRCGPVSARHTVVAGRLVVEDGQLTAPGVDEMLVRHRAAAARIQGLASE